MRFSKSTSAEFCIKHQSCFASSCTAMSCLRLCWKVEYQKCGTSTWGLFKCAPLIDRDRKEKRKKKNQLPMGFKLGISRSEVLEYLLGVIPGAGRAVVAAQVVAHQTTSQEAPSSIPAGSWAFFLLSSLSHLSNSCASLIRSLVEVQHPWFFNFPRKMK